MPDSSAPEASLERAVVDDETRPDRAEARALLREARRVHELAALVHERRHGSTIDSAPLVRRSLSLLFRAVVCLEGKPTLTSYGELVKEAQGVSSALGLCGEDFTEDALTVGAMSELHASPSLVIQPGDGRRYHRAFVHCDSVFDDLEAHVRARLGTEARSQFPWKAALVASAATGALGFFLGTRVHSSSPIPQPGPADPGVSAATARGFSATYFRDSTLSAPAITRIEPSVSFDWPGGTPPGLAMGEHFSVRWVANLFVPVTGKHGFFLTSDDGSRLFVDDRLAVDNWGNHTELQVGNTIELGSGLHSIRVEYFNGMGAAMMRFEWQPEGGARRLVEAGDLR